MNLANTHDEYFPAADLRVESERLRLGPAGFRSFFRIAEKWRLNDTDALELLSLEDDELALEQLRLAPPSSRFTEERLLRIGYLLGTYKGLHILYGDELADSWIKLPNQNALFGGTTPLEFMIHGGQNAVSSVHQLIVARCAGH